MDDQDSVDPADAALQELLATVVEHTDDIARKERLLDCLLTMPPLVEWSSQERDVLTQTCAYVASLARMMREINKIDSPANPRSPRMSDEP